MNHCYHSINGLKGAAVPAPTVTATISFPQSELNSINSSLKSSQLFISKNPQFFQDPKDMLQKISQGLNIISSRTRTQTNTNTRLTTAAKATKGASSNNNNNNVCSNKKKEHLKQLLSMFHLK